MTQSNELMTLPFGKYRGRELSEVATIDPGYLDWLAAQDWFEQKFGALFQTVITNNYFTEAAETPEHNAMQVRFLERDYQWKLARLLGMRAWWHEARRVVVKDKISELRRDRKVIAQSQPDAPLEPGGYHMHHADYEIKYAEEGLIEGPKAIAQARAAKPYVCKPQFETHGWDVVFHIAAEFSERPLGIATVLVECKPALGDDYPAVLRQMEKQWDRFAHPSENVYHSRGDHHIVCVVGEYTGRGATWEQVEKIFASKRFDLVFQGSLC